MREYEIPDGLRQSGVTSPIIFTVYIDAVVKECEIQEPASNKYVHLGSMQ